LKASNRPFFRVGGLHVLSCLVEILSWNF
jgi:hypothetical protein